MKISIWQQFSSNHSNSFTVVGEFANVEEAKKVAETLREIIGHISEQKTDQDNVDLLPAEKWYAQEYDIEWKRHLDWIWGDPDRFVVQLDDTIIVGPMMGDQTWMGSYVIDELVAKIGGQVKKEEEMRDTGLLVNIQANAPDREIALRLRNVIRDYLTANDDFWQEHWNKDRVLPMPPWVFHHWNRPDAAEEIIIAAFEKIQTIHKKLDALREEMRELRRNGASDDDNQIRRLQHEHNQVLKANRNNREDELSWWFTFAKSDTSPYGKERGDDPYYIEVRGNTVNIIGLNFGHQLGLALPALVSWLRAEGCDVEFEIESRAWSD